MTDTPTYCPLCGTKEPHECESKPKPKEEKAPESRRTGPGKYVFDLDK